MTDQPTEPKKKKKPERKAVKRSPGAGRKPGTFGKKTRVTLWLSVDVAKWIESLKTKPTETKVDRPTATIDVETVLRKSVSFLVWSSEEKRRSASQSGDALNVSPIGECNTDPNKGSTANGT